MMATMILTCLRRLFGFIDFNDFFYRRKIRNLERRIKEFKNNRIDDNKFEIKNDDKKD
jgi:hypothetical protein